MIGGIVGVIIVMAVIFMFRKTDEKVNEYKVKRDPNNFIALKKVAFKNIQNGKFEEGIEQLEKIRTAKPSDTKVNLFLGSIYYKLKDYDKAEPIIEYCIKNILVDKMPQKLRFEDDQEPLIARVFYYYGHMAHKKGDSQQAVFYKKQSRIYDKEIAESEHLY